MITGAALLVSLAVSIVSSDLQTGEQLTFRGTVVPRESTPGQGGLQKSFKLELVVLEITKSTIDLGWHIEESGRGGFSWPLRFGRVKVRRDSGATEGDSPSLLYDRGEGNSSVVQLPLPLLGSTPSLASESRWQQGRLEFEVEQEIEEGGVPVSRVAVHSPYGLKRRMLVAHQSRLTLVLQERVFMGQGGEYDLEMKLHDREQLSENAVGLAIANLEDLLAMRSRLKLSSKKDQPQWNDDQLNILKTELTKLDAHTSQGPWARITRLAKLDLDVQTGRLDAVAGMTAEHLGQTAPDFSLESLNGKTIENDALKNSKNDALKNRVTILHFWQYRETPLVEPYGQVGYLEFLHNRRHDQGIDVLGVNVDARLGDPENRDKAIRSAKKFTEFMNLSYPVLLDSGSGLERFGDPRLVGAKLPLFVVIDKQGKVVHYHVGFYDVNLERGLEELDRVAVEHLKK